MLPRPETSLWTKDVAAALSARLQGDGEIELRRLVHPSDAQGPGDLALAMSPDSAAALASTKAIAVIVAATGPQPPARFKAVITVEPSRSALAILTALFDTGPKGISGIHPTAVIAPDATLGAAVNVGAYAVIGPGSRIGAHTTIADHVSIGAAVAIGPHSLIYPGVRIGDGVEIGARVVIHHNAVIGSDGFSYAPDLGQKAPYPAGLTLAKVHSLGNVIVGDDVEIGAVTTIDRSTLQATRIGNGTKIDNGVHIAHNVTIGEGCVVCGAVGISGSVAIGDRVRIGGGVGIADHVNVGTEAIIVAGSGVAGNVAEGTTISGYPAIRHDRQLQNIGYMMRIKSLYVAFDELVRRVDELERSKK